jgi:glycosyltransferase involved in cell wall biosynthesis
MVRRAIASVRAQDYPGAIEHLVIIDDDAETLARLRCERSTPKRSLTLHLEPRPASERGPRTNDRASVYPRLARLLNLGVRLARSPWVAFLDDDNEYESEHLRSLTDCARRTGSPAVHSARQMLWPDGSPYLEELFPGAASPEEGTRIYELMCERGVWVRGTNVLQDRVDAEQSTFHNSTVMNAADPVFMVDQNVWLIRRELLVTCPIPEDFSTKDIVTNTCADDKMLDALVRSGTKIVATRRPTVRYFLGGISNGDEQRAVNPNRAARNQ